LEQIPEVTTVDGSSIEVSIVMVNFNQAQYTAQCLDSILKAPPLTSYEIILVDNASSDGSPDWLEAHYPYVKLVRSARNGGIAGGNNLGIRAACGRYILLLNNDTLVTPGTIDQTVAFLNAHPEAAGVGGNLLNADGTFQSGYANFHTLWSVFLVTTKLGQRFHPWYPSLPRGKAVKEVDWISTAFMTFRKDALEAVNLVDEEYFIYSDETDLEYRLVQAGWKIYYLPDLETIHFGGKSLNSWRRRRLVYRGYLIYFRNHCGRLQTLLLRLIFSLACLIKLPFWALTWLFPCWKERAGHEMQSNLNILQLSLKHELEAP
jgi:GT2 family glycosyltransferase